MEKGLGLLEQINKAFWKKKAAEELPKNYDVQIEEVEGIQSTESEYWSRLSDRNKRKSMGSVESSNGGSSCSTMHKLEEKGVNDRTVKRETTDKTGKKNEKMLGEDKRASGSLENAGSLEEYPSSLVVKNELDKVKKTVTEGNDKAGVEALFDRKGNESVAKGSTLSALPLQSRNSSIVSTGTKNDEISDNPSAVKDFTSKTDLNILERSGVSNTEKNVESKTIKKEDTCETLIKKLDGDQVVQQIGSNIQCVESVVAQTDVGSQMGEKLKTANSSSAKSDVLSQSFEMKYSTREIMTHTSTSNGLKDLSVNVDSIEPKNVEPRDSPCRKSVCDIEGKEIVKNIQDPSKDLVASVPSSDSHICAEKPNNSPESSRDAVSLLKSSSSDILRNSSTSLHRSNESSVRSRDTLVFTMEGIENEAQRTSSNSTVPSCDSKSEAVPGISDKPLVETTNVKSLDEAHLVKAEDNKQIVAVSADQSIDTQVVDNSEHLKSSVQSDNFENGCNTSGVKLEINPQPSEKSGVSVDCALQPPAFRQEQCCNIAKTDCRSLDAAMDGVLDSMPKAPSNDIDKKPCNTNENSDISLKNSVGNTIDTNHHVLINNNNHGLPSIDSCKKENLVENGTVNNAPRGVAIEGSEADKSKVLDNKSETSSNQPSHLKEIQKSDSTVIDNKVCKEALDGLSPDISVTEDKTENVKKTKSGIIRRKKSVDVDAAKATGERRLSRKSSSGCVSPTSDSRRGSGAVSPLSSLSFNSIHDKILALSKENSTSDVPQKRVPKVKKLDDKALSIVKETLVEKPKEVVKVAPKIDSNLHNKILKFGAPSTGAKIPSKKVEKPIESGVKSVVGGLSLREETPNGSPKVKKKVKPKAPLPPTTLASLESVTPAETLSRQERETSTPQSDRKVKKIKARAPPPPVLDVRSSVEHDPKDCLEDKEGNALPTRTQMKENTAMKEAFSDTISAFNEVQIIDNSNEINSKNQATLDMKKSNTMSSRSNEDYPGASKTEEPRTNVDLSEMRGSKVSSETDADHSLVSNLDSSAVISKAESMQNNSVTDSTSKSIECLTNSVLPKDKGKAMESRAEEKCEEKADMVKEKSFSCKEASQELVSANATSTEPVVPNIPSKEPLAVLEDEKSNKTANEIPKDPAGSSNDNKLLKSVIVKDTNTLLNGDIRLSWTIPEIKTELHIPDAKKKDIIDDDLTPRPTRKKLSIGNAVMDRRDSGSLTPEILSESVRIHEELNSMSQRLRDSSDSESFHTPSPRPADDYQPMFQARGQESSMFPSVEGQPIMYSSRGEVIGGRKLPALPPISPERELFTPEGSPLSDFSDDSYDHYVASVDFSVRSSSSPRRIYPQAPRPWSYHEDWKEDSPVVFDARLSFDLGARVTPIRQLLRPSPAHTEPLTASNSLSCKIAEFLARTDHIMDEWKRIGRASSHDIQSLVELPSSRLRGTKKSQSAANIMIKGFQYFSRGSSKCSWRSPSISRFSEASDRTLADLDELNEMTADLAEERSTGSHAAERLEAETAERIRLEQELTQVSDRKNKLEQTVEQMELELYYAKADVNGLSESEGDWDEGRDAGVYKQKCARLMREIEMLRSRLQQQHEDDLEQLVGLKKQLEKKLADAYEDVDEHRQVAAQWKRRNQNLQAELNDLRLILEEQTSRNNLLEKKQRKFDTEIQMLQDELRSEKNLRERVSRERESAVGEKYALEQSLSSARLELELKEEKLGGLSRELDELSLGGATEQDILMLRKAKHDLEMKVKDQEDELDDLAGQISILESAKLKMEMSLENIRKEHRKEIAQKEEEMEEIRLNSTKKFKAVEVALEQEHDERTLLLREKHELERRLKELEEQVRSSRATEEDVQTRLRQELRKTKALLRDASVMIERSKQSSPSRATLRALKNQLEDSELARATAEKARQTLEAELSEVNGLLEDATRAKAEAEFKAQSATRQASSLRSQMDENEEEMTEMMKKYRVVLENLTQEQNKHQEVITSLAEMEAERNSLKEQVNELMLKLESATNIEPTSDPNLRRLEAKIKELESRLELEVTVRARLEVQISRLKENLERVTEECNQYRTKDLAAQDQIRKLQRTLRECKDDLALHSQREREANLKRRDLEMRLEAAEQEAASVRNDLRLSTQRVEHLQEALSAEIGSDSDGSSGIDAYDIMEMRQT